MLSYLKAWNNISEAMADLLFIFQAIQALKLYQTTASRKALTDILENEQCFYKVRIEASLCLAKVRLIFL